MVIKSKMEIQRLGLYVGGWAPGVRHLRGSAYDSLLESGHPEIDELLVLPPLKQFSIQWVTCGINCPLLSRCVGHGAWCFDSPSSPPCLFAYESMAIASLIKSIRDRLLAGGTQLGLSQIRGGLVFNPLRRQYGTAYLVMETGDNDNGSSHLVKQRVSNLEIDSLESDITRTRRRRHDKRYMDVVSHDFVRSLSRSRYLSAPPWKTATFNLVWVDGVTPMNYLRAVVCKEFWGNELTRKTLGLNVEAPTFATSTVKVGHEADPRNFGTYEEWRDRLRHLLQFPMWCLQFVKIIVAPRELDQSELNPSLFDTSYYQGQDLEGPNRVMVVPDTPYQDLVNAVGGGKKHTIFFVCEPARSCFAHRDRIWESNLYKGKRAWLERTTGLVL